MNYELEQLLPEKYSIQDMIFYNDKANIMNKLSNILWLSKENLIEFTSQWEKLNPDIKKEILTEYENSTHLNVYFLLLFDVDYNKVDNNALLLDFLLRNHFKVSRKDYKLFKENNWLAYESVYGGKVYEFHWYSLAYIWFAPMYDKTLNLVKKIFGLKKDAALYLIKNYPQQYIPTLIKYMDKLPKPLKAKLLRELSNEKLIELTHDKLIKI